MTKWPLTTLENVINFDPKEQLRKGTIAKRISMDQLYEHKRKIYGFEYAKYTGGPKFKNGDTLLVQITPCLENGKTAQVDILDNDEIAFGTSEFIVLRGKGDTDNNFVYYFSISPTFREKAIICMEGTSGRKRVNEDAIKEFVINFPDPSSQRKIANILKSIDSKIELNESISKRIEELISTIYYFWFVQFDYPDPDGNPYKTNGGKMVFSKELKRSIPHGWSVRELHSVVDLNTQSIDPSKFPDVMYRYYSIPVFDQTGLFEETLGKYIGSNKYRIGKNDLLISKLNPKFNRVVYSTGEDNLISSTEFVAWSAKTFELKNFLFILAKDKTFITYCINSASGTSHSHNRINPEVMMQYPFAYDEKTISTFGTIIDPLIQKNELIRKENYKLRTCKNWLLPLLMNGQVKVESVMKN